MRIAVDARPMSMPMTGIGRYTQRLLELMVNSGHEWILYSDNPVEADFCPPGRVAVRNGKVSRSGLRSLAYSQGVFRRWISNDKPDVFWSPRHHLPLGLNHKVRQVVTIHDVVWKRYPETMQWQTRWAEKLLMGRSIHQADKIVCVSNFTQTEVQAFWPEQAGKCVVVRSGGNLGTEQEPLNESPASDRPYALFVGTLEPRKNLRRLIEAFDILVSQDKLQSNLIIVGAEGWGEDSLDSLIQSDTSKGRIKILGHVTDASLQQLYCSAHCLVLPSMYEGFGLPVLEAMKYGVPALISEGGSLAEIAGDSGLLVDPVSVESIANGLQAMFNDEEMRKSLSEKAFLRVSEFSWEKAANETLAVFESLVD